MPSSLKQQQFDRQIDISQIREFRSSGNKNALAEVYNKYIHLVYGLGLKYFQNRGKAQQLIIDVFKMLVDQAKNSDIANVRNWIYMCAKDLCFKQADEDSISTEQKNDWNNEKKILENNRLRINPIDSDLSTNYSLRNCVDNLYQPQKNCVKMFYFQSKSYREIAQKLDITENEVKQNISSAKQILKKCVDPSHE